MHPLFGPDHLVAMLAVGLWGAFLGPPAIWLLPIIFPLVMALGGVLGILGIPLPGVELGIALSAIVLGLMVALAARPQLLMAALLVGAFAIFHGYAHGAELPPGNEPVVYFVGFVAGDRIAAFDRHHLRPARPLAYWPHRRASGRRCDRSCRFGVPQRHRMSGFTGGLLHPLIVPAHALALLAIGLLIGQQNRGGRLIPFMLFGAGLAAGLAAIALAVRQTFALSILLAATGTARSPGRARPPVAGTLVRRAGRRRPALRSDWIRRRRPFRSCTQSHMLIGTGLGACAILATLVAGTMNCSREWQRIGVRILGSWISASAILVLALRFARGQLF